MEYTELLKHPFWQKKRLEIFQRDGFACKKCGDTLSNLQVHHSYYGANKLPWEYPNECFTTLCDLCHSKVEFMKWFSRNAIPKLHELGFIGKDIREINDLVKRKVESSYRRLEIRQYMDNIKTLMNG